MYFSNGILDRYVLSMLCLLLICLSGCQATPDQIRGNIYQRIFDHETLMASLQPTEQRILTTLGDGNMPELYYKIVNSTRAQEVTDLSKFYDSMKKNVPFAGLAMQSGQIEGPIRTKEFEYTLEEDFIYFSDGEYAQILNGGDLLKFSDGSEAKKVGNIYQ
jgi:hypothetical protein